MEERRELSIRRKVYTQMQFEDEFSITERATPKFPIQKAWKMFSSSYHPKKIVGVFTIIKMISEYNLRKDLVSDILSGLTGSSLYVVSYCFLLKELVFKCCILVGVMQIPSGKHKSI
jgi:hypothetical protein